MVWPRFQGSNFYNIAYIYIYDFHWTFAGCVGWKAMFKCKVPGFVSTDHGSNFPGIPFCFPSYNTISSFDTSGHNSLHPSIHSNRMGIAPGQWTILLSSMFSFIYALLVFTLSFLQGLFGLYYLTKYLFLFFFLLCFNVFLFSICWCFVWFIRLHKLVNQWLNELDIGDQWGHLLVAMKESWACFCSPQLHSWLSSDLFQNSNHECSSNKHSAEVYRFPVFLVESWRIAPPAIKSKCIPSNSFTNLNISSMFHPIISSGETI